MSPNICTPKQLRDPSYHSYAKCLAIGQLPIECTCAECLKPALIMPALTMRTNPNGTVVCPTCWHPIIGRILRTALAGEWDLDVRDEKYDDGVLLLVELGLLEKSSETAYAITPAGLAVLWVKERVGWEMEWAHVRGWYRSEKLNGEWACGYWSSGTHGQWIHHRWGRASKVWPIKGTGMFRFGSGAFERAGVDHG